MGNRTRRLNFCKEVWTSIQIYSGDRIKVSGSTVSQETGEVSRGSFEQFGIEIGSQMSCLQDILGGIISCVGNMAPSVESKLTENEETIREGKFRP